MTTQHSNKTIFFQPVGRLDFENSLRLKQHFESLESECGGFWVVDLTQVDFIDSSGLTTLIFGLKLANRCKVRFVLSNLAPSVRLVFEITQLDQAFEIVDRVTDVISLHETSVDTSLAYSSNHVAA